MMFQLSYALEDDLEVGFPTYPPQPRKDTSRPPWEEQTPRQAVCEWMQVRARKK